ncbi:MAG: hypothetical protein OHK0013_42100 [Sandaracinaceae bacterium]
MRSSNALLVPLLATLGLVLAAGPIADAQRRRPRSIPFEGTQVQWSLFVSAHGSLPSQRTPIGAESSAIPIPETTYVCSYGAPNRVAVNPTNWSETRFVECRFGSTVVSTSGFCQVSGASWGPHAAVLYLAEEGATERLQLTLDCTVTPPSR